MRHVRRRSAARGFATVWQLIGQCVSLFRWVCVRLEGIGLGAQTGRPGEAMSVDEQTASLKREARMPFVSVSMDSHDGQAKI